MNEEQVYALEIDGQFFSEDEPLWVHGTAGEILEQVAKELGIEGQEHEVDDLEYSSEIDYPSIRAVRAQQALEERMGKTDAYADPDAMLNGMIREGYARRLTDEEYESWMEEEEIDEYEEARGEIGEEWSDGVWET
jgi:hypothetical protein